MEGGSMDTSADPDPGSSSELAHVFGLSLGVGASFEDFGFGDISNNNSNASSNTAPSSYHHHHLRQLGPDAAPASASVSGAASSSLDAHRTSYTQSRSGTCTPGGAHTPLDVDNEGRTLSRVSSSSHTDLSALQEQLQYAHGQTQKLKALRHRQNGFDFGQDGGLEKGGDDAVRGHGLDIEDMDPQQQQQQSQQQQQQAQSTQSQAQANQMNLDALQQILAMQNLPLLGADTNSQQQQQQNSQTQTSSLQLGSLPSLQVGGLQMGASSSSSSGSASSLLEQQIRLTQLQQLQQLQAQIFQQQIELISGQSSLSNGLDSSSQQQQGQAQGQLFRDFQGLPTPASSTELRAQPSSNFVSPMILQNFMAPQAPSNTPLQQFSSPNPNPLPQGPSSAPAHLAFHITHPSSLNSPADIGPPYDFSPITSPWLEPYQPDHTHSHNHNHNHNHNHGHSQLGQAQQQQSQSQQQQQQQQQSRQSGLSPLSTSGGAGGTSLSTPQVRATRSSTKRGASSSGGEDAPGPGDSQTQAQKHQQQARKRTSLPPSRAGTGPSSVSQSQSQGQRRQQQQHARGTASLTSTPAMRARGRKNSSAGASISAGIGMGMGVGMGMLEDTPSPVDLSMPPPAPPAEGGAHQVQQQQQQLGQGQGQTSPTTIAPVTPAAIMGLGRLGLSSGLAPLDGGAADTTGAGVGSVGQQGQGKRKSPPKAGPSSSSSSSSSTRAGQKKASPRTLIGQSPSLKPLLPGGLTPSSALHLATASNYTHHLAGSASSLNLTPSAPLPQPALQVRKTSHKAAEQKRRDSLKSSFDDLRLLLPPLPLPSDENYSGEPPLPGALPPRGPPRGEAAGPNRAVSKLQLLRCGNDFIRRLKERVGRRDEYIEELKTEVRVLRAQVGALRKVGATVEGVEGVDVDADADVDVDVGLELGLEALDGAFQRVDLDKDLDAAEANAPKLGGLAEGDEADEEGE